MGVARPGGGPRVGLLGGGGAAVVEWGLPRDQRAEPVAP
jgi:hypothetical protein